MSSTASAEADADLVARVARARQDHDAALVDRLIEHKFIGDPPADALIAAFSELPGRTGWQLLEAGMALGDESVAGAPAALHDLLHPLAHPPAWFDPDLADAGALAFWRGGAAALHVAYTCGALAFGYQSASLVRPLAATGRLERMAPRRLAETSRWVVAVTEPGAMHPGAEGWRASVRVRCVHALVRRHLNASAGWDHDAWGTPISATDALATAIGGFTVIPLRAMRDLGVRHTRAELEAMTHLWKWIGYVMGVPEVLLPSSAAEAEAMVDCGLALDTGPNEDSPRLMRALLEHGLPFARMAPRPLRAPTRMLTSQVLGGFARRWMGDAMADRLDVPRGPVSHVVPLLRPLTRAREVARATGLLGSEERLVAAEIALVRRGLGLQRAAPGPIAPEHVAGEPVLAAA